MSMKTMEKLRDMLCRELDEIAEKGELTAGALETVHKLTDTIKNLDKIQMFEDGGYSQGMGDWEAHGRYGGNSYDDGGNSYNGYSQAHRGQHYVRGHYSRGDGRMYSRDDGKEHMTRKLEELMNQADGKEREVLRRALDTIKRG